MTAAELDLQHDPELLQSLLAISGQLVVVMDEDARVRLFSPACEQLTGYAADEILGRTIWSILIPEAELPKVRDVARQLHEHGGDIQFTNHWLTRNGGRRLIQWRNRVWRPSGGERRFIIATGIDITEQQQAVEARRHSRDELIRLLDALPVLIAHLDNQYRIRFANRGYLEWFSLDPDRLTGRHIREVIGREAFATLQPSFDKALSGWKAVYHDKVPYTHKGTRFIHGTYIPSHDKQGHVDGIYILAVDISEEQRLRSQLEEELKRSHTIVDNAIDGIIVADSQSIIRSFNPAAESLFGYRAEEIIGQNIGVLMPDGDDHDQHVRRYLETGQAKIIGTGREVTGRRKDGSSIELRLAVAEVQENGRSFIGFTQDISAQKRAEREAREHFAELAHVTRLGAMNEITSGLTHEISQPLTAIAASIEACLMTIEASGGDAVKLKPALEQVSRQGQRARDIIEQLRTFLRKGQPENIESCQPRRLIDNVLKLLTHEIEAADISVRVELDPDMAPWLVNRVQIEQVLFNLAKNAIDAMRNKPGERLLLLRGRTLDGCHEVAVMDTGPGIEDKYLDRLFHPFFTTKADGLGQGLSICRSIIQRHGGELGARNREEGGAFFRFTLPLTPPEDD